MTTPSPEQVAAIVKPRRRIVVNLALEGDNWREIMGAFRSLATEIAVSGCLSTNCVSGGYGSGWIMTSSEDATITHESWEADLNAYLAHLERIDHDQ